MVSSHRLEGYIGYSAMVNFAAAGVKCIGVDVNPSLVEALSGGETRGFRRFHPDRRLKVDLRV